MLNRPVIAFMILFANNVYADEVSDKLLAKSLTGIEIDSGPPLFSLAKQKAFLLGRLQGAEILCGSQLTDGSPVFHAMVGTFPSTRQVELLKLIKAGVQYQYKTSRVIDPKGCITIIKGERALDAELLRDFSG